MSRPSGLRRRLFITLFLAALIPTALALAGGTLLLRGVITSTGSAGPWGAVADSGRELLEVIAAGEPDPALAEAAARHREILSESVRLSQVYALIGDRIVVLIPLAGLVLLALVAGISALATGRLARSLSAPAEDLADWIRALGSAQALPPVGPRETGRSEVREFRTLRKGIREAAAQLEAARQREAERIRARSWAEMARRVAHELKNPLMPMRMAAERVARSDDAAAAEAGEVLLEEIGRLDGLARSFAQFGRAEEGPTAEVDVTELLSGIVRRLAREGAPVEAVLPEEPLVVQGHLTALERVVRNLLSNALEAQELPGGGRVPYPRPHPRPSAGSGHGSGGPGAGGSAGGPSPDPSSDPAAAPAPRSAVRLELSREGDSAVITVEDDGPGIALAILERIWEPDFTTRRRGTGLGLPLVRQAVEAHGGRVRAENRPAGGARFVVELPLDGAPPPSSLPAHEETDNPEEIDKP